MASSNPAETALDAHSGDGYDASPPLVTGNLSFHEITDLVAYHADVPALAGDVPIVAKIELAQAYENLDDILGPAFAIMVARGDLGVQLPLEQIPLKRSP